MDSLDEAFDMEAAFDGLYHVDAPAHIADYFPLHQHDAVEDLDVVDDAAADIALLPKHPAPVVEDLDVVDDVDADLGLLPQHPAPGLEDEEVEDPLEDQAVLEDEEVEAPLEDEEGVEDPNPNPWKEVRSRKFGRKRRNVPEVYPPIPPVRESLVEVEWLPKIGSRRSIRKHSQSRKSGNQSTADGPGFYAYYVYIPDANY